MIRVKRIAIRSHMAMYMNMMGFVGGDFDHHRMVGRSSSGRFGVYGVCETVTDRLGIEFSGAMGDCCGYLEGIYGSLVEHLEH